MLVETLSTMGVLIVAVICVARLNRKSAVRNPQPACGTGFPAGQGPNPQSENGGSLMGFPKPKNLLKAPWPPGVDWRIVDAGPLGKFVQLRPGASMPAHAYNVLAADAIRRAFRYGQPPCLN